MIKILTVYGTRPELIKISCLIKELDKNFNHILVNTNQNFNNELNKNFLKNFKIRKPNYNLNIQNISSIDAISEVMTKTKKVLLKEKPDVFLIYGDTNSTYSALVAKSLKIPVFHMEAGNRSFDQRIPEEINRKLIDHLSDINIVISEQARQNLIREGISPEFILKSGSHMEEIFLNYKKEIQESKALRKLKLKKDEYFLASIHRAELVDSKEDAINLIKSFENITKTFKKKIILSTHPRLKKNMDLFKINKNNKNIIFLKPFDFFDYINLSINSYCVLSDSGSLFEESFLLKYPAVSIRKSNERLEGVETGSVIISGYDSKRIIKSIQLSKKMKFTNRYSDYNGGLVSEKITKFIISYYHKINEKIWYKK
tara:strand:- start:2281 stop:3393 length:1113 start_codon:yes stop_codon:yes gene_type:complete